MSSTRGPTLAEVIRRSIDARLLDLRVCLPAVVTSYDASKQMVSVQPLLKQVYEDEEGARQVESLPIVNGVPVVFPGGGGFRLTFPIVDGQTLVGASVPPATTGILVFTDRSLDRWLSGSGAEVDPEIDHDHHLADAVFIPGLHPFGSPLSSAPATKLTLGTDASPTDIEIDSLGNVTIANGSNGAARQGDSVSAAAAAATWAGQVEGFINGTVPGTVTPLFAVGAGLPGGLATIFGHSNKVKIG